MWVMLATVMASSRRQFLLGAAVFGGGSIARGSARANTAATSTITKAQIAGVPATRAQPENILAYRRNWGRWGADDQMGAVNLITPAKRTAAAALVKTGRTLSLSRVFEPEQHFMRISERENRGTTEGVVVDYYGFLYHGAGVTHLDALCHMWDDNGMWNGRDPAKEIDTNGARFADITAFGGGLITRGVLLDVPRHRRTAYVTMDRPVHGTELAAIADAQGVKIEPGDAVFVYSGREAFVREMKSYGPPNPRPGLHVSCARFIRDRDVAVLGWDMADARPDGGPVHGVLYSYGVALLDNALLEPLAQMCADEQRWEFMFMTAPLKIALGTGSPVNPIALF
jgi:kynurenine formamidase